MVGGLEHRLTPSHQSKGGKYRSMRLELIVQDEEQRLAIFGALKVQRGVRFIL